VVADQRRGRGAIGVTELFLVYIKVTTDQTEVNAALESKDEARSSPRNTKTQRWVRTEALSVGLALLASLAVSIQVYRANTGW
jgi:hypothetical protein